jgi:hypothetical protein
MDGIFSNPGRRIKNWAKVLYVIEIIVAVIGGIAMIAADDDMFLFGLLTAAVGILAAFITALFLYAFGELVESSQENRDINRQILLTLGGNAPQAPQQAPQYAPQYAPQQSAAPAAPQRVKPTPVPSGDTTPGVWYCRSCGNATSNSYSTCTQCGLPKSR